jgi:hypothetical protein
MGYAEGQKNGKGMLCSVLIWLKDRVKRRDEIMGRTKAEMAKSLLKLSDEIDGLSSGFDEMLKWIENGEDPQVIIGVFEHHPHSLAALALRVKALAADLSHQASEEATESAINKMRL